MTDLLDLIAELELADTPWEGAPLAYTAVYWTPDELIAATDRWIAEHGHFASSPQSHMWCQQDASGTADHQCVVLLADTRFSGPRMPCPREHDHTGLPDKLMYQANCAACRWHEIAANENAVIEAWHDHAMPGWRDLPVLPINLTRRDTKDQLSKPAAQWIDEHQPLEWRFPGAPIRTARQKYGVRHVVARSPYGGYDLGDLPDDEDTD